MQVLPNELAVMKKTLLIILLILAGISATAQKDGFHIPDSLLVALEKNPQQDMARVEALTRIIIYYTKNRRIIQAEPYIEEINQISENIDDKYVNALADLYEGNLLFSQDKYQDALMCLKKSLKQVLYLPQNDKTLELEGRILNSLGALFCNMRLYYEGYEYLLKALETCKKINDQYLISVIETNMATPLNQIGRCDEAIALCEKNLTKGVGLTPNRFILYLILSQSYKNKASYDTALIYNDSAFMHAVNRYDESKNLTEQAALYIKKGDNEAAIKTYKYILDNYRNEMFKDAEIIALCDYGYLIGLDSMSDLAISYIDSAIVKAKEFGIPKLEKECYASKVELFYKHHEYQEFAESTAKYISLRNSIDSANDLRRLENAWISQEFKKTEEQLRLEKELSDMKNERAKMRLYFIISGLISIIVILALAFNRRNILMKNKDIQLKKQELEKEVLNKEIETRNRELTAKALVQVQRQELLTEMADKLNAIVDDKHKIAQNLKEVINDIEKYKNSTTPEDFDYYFTQTNPDFYKHLLADFPNLTPYEQRLCAFLRLNLSTKDIASIINISPESAKVARARLRKSLNLVGKEEDLTAFLSKY